MNIVELAEHPEAVMEICNRDQTIVFKGGQGEEFLRLSFDQFDAIYQVAAERTGVPSNLMARLIIHREPPEGFSG